ncbi:MAG: twin-arginine translocation signal domain-containing protein [Acidobacteriota bacterium]|nr:twin-arginine translocation signal domain-containing protein [Acidobacteriota bacterium]
MRELLDDLFMGTVSRRSFMKRATAAGLALPVIGGALAGEVEAQNKSQDKKTQKPKPTGPQEENPVYSPANIGGGGRIERNFYRDWTRHTNVPKIDDPYSVYDVVTQEVKPWPEIGGRGLYLNFTGNVHMDGVIYEIPEGKALVPRQHFYEQVFIVLKGRGHSLFGAGPRKAKVEWGEGSLFAGPVNVPYRHFNDDSSHPARLLAITSFPFMLQVFGNLDLINNLNFAFKDRYNDEPDYFSKTERVRKRWDKTNFVKDIRNAEVVPWPERGGENASIFWDMSGNTILEPHMSEFEVGGYKLGHRHPYEAIILTLNGKGFSIAGKESLKESDTQFIPWKAGSVVSPPYFWYHQHFNTGTTKARYFAMTEGDFPKRLGIPLQVEQIEADREDPEIKKRFERELKKAQATASASNEQMDDHKHDHDHHHDHDDHGGIMFVENRWKRRSV